jgi:voltage-gated sodium channel
MTVREKTAQILATNWVQRLIIGVILFNAVILGLESSDTIMDNAGTLIDTLDTICLWIFVLEILAKLFAQHFRFFRSGWNVFDFVIVGSLRRVVEGFLTALPGMGSVFMLMSLIFYIGSVIATKLFGETFPQWFGSLGHSAYSLFQIMTLESWSMGIVRPVMVEFQYAWAFFIPFIMVTTFAVVNLLVGLIVNSMQDAHHEESNAATDTYRDEVLVRLEAIEKRLPKQP